MSDSRRDTETATQSGSSEYAEYDPQAICFKCGQTPVGTRYCSYTTPGLSVWSEWHFPMWVYLEGGHLHRECGRCGYKWVERALGARTLTQEEREGRLAAYQKASEEYAARAKKGKWF